jgi:hypothetical protein
MGDFENEEFPTKTVGDAMIPFLQSDRNRIV